MRESSFQFLSGQISRRQFVSRLIELGVTSGAAPLLMAQIAPVPSTEPSRILTHLTGGEVMAEFLKEWKVRYVFGLGGSEEVGFLDALVDRSELRYVTGLHENAVFSMADGYARASGETALVNLHSVVGTANALGALVNAFKDGISLVVTVGRQATGMRGRGAFLEAPNLHLLPQEYTRWTWDVMRADTIPETLRRAFHFAEIPPGGPAFVTFSKDLWETQVKRCEIIRRSRSSGPYRIPPDPAALRRLGEWLLAAEKPLVVAGSSVDRSGAGRRLAALSERMGFGVASDLGDSHSPITYPTLHKHYLGLFGREASMLQGCDLFVSLGGTMFTEFGSPEQPHVPRSVRTVHISPAAQDVGRTYPVDLPMVADAGSVVSGLETLLAEGALKPDAGRVGRLSALFETHHRRRTERLESELAKVMGRQPWHPAQLMTELNRGIPDEAWMVTELATSDEALWDYMDFHHKEAGRRHVVSSGGSLGWGIGAALGVKLAQPRKPVVLLTGDGSYQFGVQALWSAARYRIPVLIVIFNNADYQANRRALARYGKRALAEKKFVGCYLGNPDIDHVAIARGYGVEGARVEKAADFSRLLARGLQSAASGKPFVLDVPVDRLYPGADSQWDGSFSVAQMA